VLLGKIRPEYFPSVFGADGRSPLDAAVVQEQFTALAQQVGRGQTPESLAAGFIRIAVENMANAIKKISVARGHDVTEYTLTCFGGAGGQHACLVADALGMRNVFIHPLAGVLSAYGIGLADVRVIRQQAVEAVLDAQSLEALDFKTLESAAHDAVAAQGIAPERIRTHRRLFLKYQGTDGTLELPPDGVERVHSAFEKLYRVRYGFLMTGARLVIESIAVEAVGLTEVDADAGPARAPRAHPLQPLATHRVYCDGEWRETPFFDRESLRAGDVIDGPAVIREANTTTMVETGWRLEVSSRDHLLLTRIAPVARAQAIGTRADPVLLEVFNNLFMSIAEQMGVTLANVARSVNIKERLDFSCALFDGEGQLIANAPHMPVHLGSMGESVKAVMTRRTNTMRSGDVFVLNAPYAGGTHLPDVTVIMPVFLQGASPTFFVAARGHHADIGGITPGSMPSHSKHIDEEGVLIDNVQLVDQGHFLEQPMRELLQSARNVEQNLADLKAQVAACQKGAEELAGMVEHYGLAVVQAYMQHVQNNAEEAVRRVIGVLKDGEFEYAMDNGSKVRVALRIDAQRREATIDFTGTSEQQPNNFNAPLPVTRAAVLYVFRTLVDDEIPMNAGCLKPLRIVVPEGSMLNPRYPAAVVAGNVETSQVITDCLYGALGAMAASQGTMNNFTFGNDRHQYYETIAGGSGAGPGFDGADAVQTHMTNSRLTDPEVLEWRFPVRVESFSIRRGSGGAGAWRGGDGVDRRIRFLEPMTAVMLANHRTVAPFGLAGGEPASTGCNWVERADGSREDFGATHETALAAGDVFVVQTPGGGGYGSRDT
jgi:5-oxoprolinase (ATP-hydrolysing)